MNSNKHNQRVTDNNGLCQADEAVPLLQIRQLQVTSSTYLSLLSRMYLRARWSWLSLPVVLCVTLAALLADVRWLIVGLMVLFVVIPMLLALAYFNYALSLEARWSLLSKDLTLNDEGIAMQFDDDRVCHRLLHWDQVSRLCVADEYLLLMLSVRRFTFLVIPFADIERAQLSVRQVALYIRQHIDASTGPNQ